MEIYLCMWIIFRLYSTFRWFPKLLLCVFIPSICASVNTNNDNCFLVISLLAILDSLEFVTRNSFIHAAYHLYLLCRCIFPTLEGDLMQTWCFAKVKAHCLGHLTLPSLYCLPDPGQHRGQCKHTVGTSGKDGESARSLGRMVPPKNEAFSFTRQMCNYVICMFNQFSKTELD